MRDWHEVTLARYEAEQDRLQAQQDAFERYCAKHGLDPNDDPNIRERFDIWREDQAIAAAEDKAERMRDDDYMPDDWGWE